MSIQKYIAYLKTIETGSITRAAAQLGYGPERFGCGPADPSHPEPLGH